MKRLLKYRVNHPELTVLLASDCSGGTSYRDQEQCPYIIMSLLPQQPQ